MNRITNKLETKALGNIIIPDLMEVSLMTFKTFKFSPDGW